MMQMSQPLEQWVILPMQHSDLCTVLQIEPRIDINPWARPHFELTLNQGGVGHCLHNCTGQLVGFSLMNSTLDEVHLLRIGVDCAWQGRGLGKLLLAEVIRSAGAMAARWLWLEVRASNRRARRLYCQFGFQTVGCRKGYYPLSEMGQREDAWIMRLDLKEWPNV